MRLDKFLKVSRIIKRRTVANEVCDMARVFVNDNPAKPAKQLKEGDTITIEYKVKILKVRVLKIPNGNVSVNEADSLYEILSE
ncbi:MAG: RNA-binding S4 domain-containing protein [bacterium]|nr:RNA-binding S4 domain-containing protein [bacterium]